MVRDHCLLFSLVAELDFPVGKKLLIQVLRGEQNDRIKKLRLHQKIHFGCLGGYQEEELEKFLDYMLRLTYLEIQQHRNRYPVVLLTKKGEEELLNPEESFRVDDIDTPKQLYERDHKYTVTPITPEDRAAFNQYASFLEEFTDEQKQAIISRSPKQLCIAGAGSGKTKVLTNKIAFLHKHAGVPAKEILAITFTRKARKEMQTRLASLLPGVNIRIETFNSFAEKELLRKGMTFYKKEKRMATTKEFVTLVLQAIQELGYSVDLFMQHYFTAKERRGKEPKDMFFSFLYDFRAILDTFTQNPKLGSYEQQLATALLTEKTTALNVLKLCEIVLRSMNSKGLRTFSDQLTDVTKMYEQYPELRERYHWILVDEYQDVNELQVQLIDLISPKNLFAVGDPRQSIYAWRGSNPEKIYEFITDQTAVFELTTNFRSTQRVVDTANAIIANAYRGNNSFAPMVCNHHLEGLTSIMKFTSEDTESIAVVSQIKDLAVLPNEIFVLSRTNKGLEKIREQLEREGIKYIIRTEEKQVKQEEDAIVLSTVHAAKGLEAEIVFVVGANMNMYPCKAKDHRYVTLLSDKGGYDTYEEERRIFYVACTRAKKELRISYYGAPSPFLAKNVLVCATHHGQEKQVTMFRSTGSNPDVIEQQRQALRRWRYLEAQNRDVPPYMIFSDRALDHLLEMQPLTIDELLEVSGFGKTKVKAFGEDILHVMYR